MVELENPFLFVTEEVHEVQNRIKTHMREMVLPMFNVFLHRCMAACSMARILLD